jgi:tRNA modification GTPase
MLEDTFEDTIIAISTPPGYGGIGIIRLSGKDSLILAKRIFKPNKSGIKIQPRTAVFGNLVDFERNEALDEGYILYFPAPRSYTRENVVEISCHGSPVVLEEALRLGIRAGARQARPGEFTLRAYLHGRIDILQAEAVNDLIRAVSVETARMAFGQVEGKLSKKMKQLRARAVELIAQVEASIEFPDDNLGITPRRNADSLEKMIAFVEGLVSSYDLGRALVNGVTLAITGRTNVGKSTLFNALLEEERAIVTARPGTTRDYLKEKIKIENTYFNLVDMAGLGKSSTLVEKEGIKIGRSIASQADGVLLMLDISRKENSEDTALLEEFQGKKALIVFNKIDKPPQMDISGIRKDFSCMPGVKISALKGTNLARLKEKIKDVFSPKINNHEDVILHQRQKLLLEKAFDHLKKGYGLLKQGHAEEIYLEEIRGIIPVIGRLTGEIPEADIIENIFERFCVGK